MKISEVCNVTGLTKKAIEYYQVKGIIKPKTDESGYREFSNKDMEILEQVKLLRSLGLSVNEVKTILDSKYPKEELRKCVIRKELENVLQEKQIQLLSELSQGESMEDIKNKILEINKKKSIKERLLEFFPGFYGRFYLNHFAPYLEGPIETKEQNEAFEIIVQFLDEVRPPEIPEEIMGVFEETMEFWTDEMMTHVEERRQKDLENPIEFMDENLQDIEDYMAFKESEEYHNSPFGQLMEAMKSFGETSGYNEIFIPGMRKISPSYEEYYQNLLKANEVFIERFPEYK